MKMFRSAALSLFVLFGLANFAAAGNTNGCLIDGESPGQYGMVKIKDCLQNAGIPGGQFLEICKGLMKAGISAGVAAKLTLVEQCPSGYQGRCLGVLEQQMDGYHYMRSSADLQQLAGQCAAQGGRWSNN